MRVTSKGQVTIPKEIRDHLGIVPGSEVDFVREAGKVRLVAQARVVVAGTETFEAKLRKARPLLRPGPWDSMSGKDYTDWLRGLRDDLGVD